VVEFEAVGASGEVGSPLVLQDALYEKGSDNTKRSTLLALAKFFKVSLDYLADDDVNERTPRITGAAAHFDLDKLTPEGRERYEEFIEFLADKYSKE